MKQEKWEEIKGKIKDQFEVIEEKKEPLMIRVGLEDSQKAGDKDIIIFQSPIGKVKLEYLIKPVILDKKEHFSKRAGTSARTEYELSETEFVRRMEAYKWNEADQDWQSIDKGSFS